MEHVINLVVGDWSHDGHSKTSTITIKSNLSKKEIEKAFKAGAKKLGVNISKFCEEYEDSTLPLEGWKKFLAAGYPGSPDEDEPVDEDDEPVSLDSDGYADLWLFTVFQGNPDFKHESLSADASEINIGGYGLYYS